MSFLKWLSLQVLLAVLVDSITTPDAAARGKHPVNYELKLKLMITIN